MNRRCPRVFQARRAWATAAVTAVVLLVAPAGASAFDTGPHSDITRDALIAEGAQEAWGGEGKARIVALFRHSAFVLLARGDEAAARACLAGAAAFEKRPPAENPLAQALFERPLTGFLEQLEQKEREEAEQGSLIVKPGDPLPGAGPGGIR